MLAVVLCGIFGVTSAAPFFGFENPYTQLGARPIYVLNPHYNPTPYNYFYSNSRSNQFPTFYNPTYKYVPYPITYPSPYFYYNIQDQIPSDIYPNNVLYNSGLNTFYSPIQYPNFYPIYFPPENNNNQFETGRVTEQQIPYLPPFKVPDFQDSDNTEDIYKKDDDEIAVIPDTWVRNDGSEMESTTADVTIDVEESMNQDQEYDDWPTDEMGTVNQYTTENGEIEESSERGNSEEKSNSVKWKYGLEVESTTSYGFKKITSSGEEFETGNGLFDIIKTPHVGEYDVFSEQNVDQETTEQDDSAVFDDSVNDWRYALLTTCLLNCHEKDCGCWDDMDFKDRQGKFDIKKLIKLKLVIDEELAKYSWAI